ncbi:hypothetical protein EVAR_82941_1 [Eumeta japonica]|uniref:Reverse transcriptase domain-containing protein n=1 Tax=Eumeta variegata TaxID=151549 RepID=A0A4C1X4D2_EUMVA|nr:hypothetical protein EVAR_82941_1 [Eumeta japonica]
MKTLKRMKVGKAAEYVGVSSETLRGGGGIVAGLLSQLFIEYWKSYRVRDDRYKAVIVPFCKGKGSRQVCKTYRSITLISVVGKLYAEIMMKRVVNETENKIWDVQAGF